MAGEKKAIRILIAAFIWLVIVGAVGAAYKFLLAPRHETSIRNQTGSDSQYKYTVNLGVDSFSGYAVLRSEQFRNQLASQKVQLRIEDDQADYQKRIQALKDGKIQLAVFTIDSFIKSGAMMNGYPGTIILVIDESKGADAIISNKNEIANIDSLNHPDVRFVLTENSPSEFLARVVLAHFNLPALPSKWWIGEDGAENVYRQMQMGSSNPDEKRAYVLWEPYVSQALTNPNTHVLLDSSKLKGYIIDILVAERQFVIDHPELVRGITESYLRTLYSLSRDVNQFTNLIIQDAKQNGENISQEQAKKLVESIQWKNTLENFAHFGLLPSAQMQGLQHIEDLIQNISGVLVTTGALSSDPIGNQAHNLFYDRVMKQLQAENFHPGRSLNVLSNIDGLDAELEQVRGDNLLVTLTESEWKKLTPVGSMNFKPISFGRGKANLMISGKRSLQDLAKQLEAWPAYYVTVQGHARAEGDREANLALAAQRAETVVQYLIEQGISKNRLRAVSAELSSLGGASQSVSFIVGQLPY